MDQISWKLLLRYIECWFKNSSPREHCRKVIRKLSIIIAPSVRGMLSISSNIITIGDTDFQKLLNIRVNGPMHSLENFEFLNHKNYVIHRVSVSYSLAQLIMSWLFQ